MVGLLLINLGTPNSPNTSDVKKYLRQFLSDPQVIDINPIARWLLVNLIIAPFRSPKSAKAYQSIWTKEGSPLLVNSLKLKEKVAQELGENFCVELAMRYQNPSIESALKKLMEKKIDRLIVLPLYPQYALSSTQSSIEEVKRILKLSHPSSRLGSIFVPPFYNHPGFINSFVERGKEALKEFKPDHILFSYHGLPERHLKKVSPENNYKTQCIETTSLIAQGLGLGLHDYSFSFQSRLGRTKWIEPYTDELIISLAQSGKKKLMVFCPSFVADCLETLEEIIIRGKTSFKESGGDDLYLIPSLNDSSLWSEAVCTMVRKSDSF